MHLRTAHEVAESLQEKRTNQRVVDSCECDSGWAGPADTCTDADECNGEPCDENASCENTPGDFACTCDSDYVGDGFTCSPEGGGGGVDWSGSFDVVPDFSYSCVDGFMTYNFFRAFFVDSGSALEVDGIARSIFSPAPVEMYESISDEGVFSVSRTLPGPCTEGFLLTGEFVDDDNWTGRFTLDIVPDGCFDDCADQTLFVSGSRP